MHFDIRGALTQEQQMSEAFFLSVVLAFSGGFQDAYTYMVRGHVYANAQTGNVVMMSTHLMTAHWAESLAYFFPLLAFALGVFAASHIHLFVEHRHGKLHWRQYVIALESLIMLAVGFMPQSANLPANCLVSFACAMQVQSFRTVHGYAYASTMCIGNLRGGMASLSEYFYTRDKAKLERAKYYLGVIIAFAVGAGVGGNLCPLIGERSVWICCALLAFGYWLLGWKGRRKNHLKEIFQKYGW